MSHEPTQPMRPPSTLSPDQDGGPQHGGPEDGGPEDGDGQVGAGQVGAAQGDAGQVDAAQDTVVPASATATTVSPNTVSPNTVSADTVSPDTVSPDTVPRGVLAQGRAPAPPGNAPQAPQTLQALPTPQAPPIPQGGWGQDGAAAGYAPQDYGPQDYPPQAGPQGYGPQDGPQGYGPQDGPQGYGPQDYGPQGYEPQDGPPPKPRRRRRPVRKSVIAFFILLVLAIVLVIANFVGRSIAENDMADQFTANGLPVKPSVNIEGFPFLTQVVQKDFKKVVISASNIPAGPVTISSLNATITGMHLNSSWNGATIDHLNATAFVSLSSLTDGISSELGDGVSLTAVPDGANKLKVTGTVLGLSASADVEIKQTGPQQITIELPKTGGLVGTLMGAAPSFPINLPAGVPPSLRITGLTLNGQGLTLSAAATDATFSK
jgi:DUF2993 family protein